MPFVPHQTIPGVSPEAAQALLEIQRQIGQDLDDLRRGPVVTSLQRADYSSREDEYVRCAPPAGGMTIVLPLSRPQNQGRSIRVLVETVLSGGGITISATRGTINGLVTITLTTVGLVEFTSDGLGNWLSAWAPGTTGTTPGVAGTILTPQGPPAQQQEERRAPIIPGPRGLTGKSAPPAPPGVPGVVDMPRSVIPGVLQPIPFGNVLGVPNNVDNSNETPRALTPFVLGTLVRFGSQFSDTTSSGSISNYALPDPYTGVTFNPPADVTILGVSGGQFNAGRVLYFVIDKDATFTVTLAHNSASATANRRFLNSELVDLVLHAGDAALLFHDPIQDRWIPMLINPRGRLLAATHYTSGTGTHTYDTRTTYYEAHKQAGGAAGGGVPSCSAIQSAAGGGGQAGPFAIASGAPAAATASYVVGAGGAGASGADGGAGADTTFDAVGAGADALGGQAGVASATATATAGGGNNSSSNQGDAGSAGFSSAVLFAAGGKGGSGRYGGGGWAPVTTAANNIDGALGRKPGAGGSGAVNIGIGSAKVGGGGATGDLWVYEWS